MENGVQSLTVPGGAGHRFQETFNQCHVEILETVTIARYLGVDVYGNLHVAPTRTELEATQIKHSDL